MTTYYKCLAADNRSVFGKDVAWLLPTQNSDGSWKPGRWMPSVKGEIELCNNGYHVCELKDLLHWINASVYTAEIKTDILDGDNKSAGRRIRLLAPTGWNSRTARLLLADCAEHVLPIFEAKYPIDSRPRQAIKAARQFAEGKIAQKELNKASKQALAASRGGYLDAAASAAEAAAWATCAGSGWYLLKGLINIAAHAAEARAAEVATETVSGGISQELYDLLYDLRTEVWANERKWQTGRLTYYLALPAEQEEG